MDRLVAEHVIGRHDVEFRCPDCSATHFGNTEEEGVVTRRCHGHGGGGCGWSGDPLDAAPPYSTEIAHAWDIIERMKADRFLFPEVHENARQAWCALWENREGQRYGWLAKQYGLDAPHAICLAGLEWKDALPNTGPST